MNAVTFFVQSFVVLVRDELAVLCSDQQRCDVPRIDLFAGS